MPVATRKSANKPLTEPEAWAIPPSARDEARHLFQMLGRNGDDVESLRALINVSPVEQAHLREFGTAEPRYAPYIEKVLEFRGKVLREFDRLCLTNAIT